MSIPLMANAATTQKCWSLDSMTMRLHHREHKCKHYTWVWFFQLNYSTNPFFFFPQTKLLLFFFIKAHTIKYVHREVRNIWKHLKKVHTRQNILSVLKAPLLLCWECVLSFISLPVQYPLLYYSAPRAGKYLWDLRAFRAYLVQDACLQDNSGTRQYSIPDSSSICSFFHYSFFITITIQSLTLPFVPEHQTKISTLLFPTSRNCRAANKLSKKSEDDWNNQLSPS